MLLVHCRTLPHDYEISRDKLLPAVTKAQPGDKGLPARSKSAVKKRKAGDKAGLCCFVR
jgi:hypothetical protein